MPITKKGRKDKPINSPQIFTLQFPIPSKETYPYLGFDRLSPSRVSFSLSLPRIDLGCPILSIYRISTAPNPVPNLTMRGVYLQTTHPQPLDEEWSDSIVVNVQIVGSGCWVVEVFRHSLDGTKSRNKTKNISVTILIAEKVKDPKVTATSRKEQKK